MSSELCDDASMVYYVRLIDSVSNRASWASPSALKMLLNPSKPCQGQSNLVLGWNNLVARYLPLGTRCYLENRLITSWMDYEGLGCLR